MRLVGQVRDIVRSSPFFHRSNPVAAQSARLLSLTSPDKKRSPYPSLSPADQSEEECDQHVTVVRETMRARMQSWLGGNILRSGYLKQTTTLFKQLRSRVDTLRVLLLTAARTLAAPMHEWVAGGHIEGTRP